MKSIPLGLASAFFCISAQAACTGYACDGRDPNTEGCAADGVTVASAIDTTANLPYAPKLQILVELRWSNKCKTNWARLSYVKPPPFPRYDGLNRVTVTRWNDGKSVYFDNAKYYDFNSIYSPMLYGNKLCTKASGTSRKWFEGWWTAAPVTRLIC